MILKHLISILFFSLHLAAFCQFDVTEEKITPPWDSVNTKIFPVIKIIPPAGDMTPIQTESVYNYYGEGIVVFYQVNNHYFLIDNNDLKIWRIDKDSLHETALQNLKEYASSHVEATLEKNSKRLQLQLLDSDYDVSLILLESYISSLKEILASDHLIFGVPTNSILFAIDADSSEELKKLASDVVTKYKNNKPSLSLWLLELKDNQWSLFKKANTL